MAVDAPVGAVLEVAPDNYTTVSFGGVPYYYGGGLFYRRVADQGRTTFVVSAAPVGVVVDTLPFGYTTTVVAGATYYRGGGVYYRRVYDRGRVAFTVVANPF